MIKSQLIAGIRNSSHQIKVLSEMTVLNTLEILTERLLTLDSTEKPSSHFQPGLVPLENSSASAVTSEYQKMKFPKQKDTNTRDPSKNPSQSPKCRGCGRPWHKNKRRQCPALGEESNKCGRLNHFASACLSSSNAAMLEDQPSSVEDGTSFISTVTTADGQ